MTVATRREREQKLRKDAILESARQLFELKGFEATTVDEIAVKAELGKGTIYSYYKSKEEIYVAILERWLDLLKEKMDKALDNSTSAVDALDRLFNALVEYLKERKSFTEALFVQVDQQLFYRLGGVVSGVKFKSSVWMELVVKVLETGIARGEFHPCDVEKVSKLIIGMILGLIVQHEIGRLEDDLPLYRNALMELLLQGIGTVPHEA